MLDDALGLDGCEAAVEVYLLVSTKLMFSEWFRIQQTRLEVENDFKSALIDLAALDFAAFKTGSDRCNLVRVNLLMRILPAW